MNHVDFLLNTPLDSLSYEDRLLVKRLGPHQPLDYSYSVKDGKQTRHFKSEWFSRFPSVSAVSVNMSVCVGERERERERGGLFLYVQPLYMLFFFSYLCTVNI